MSHRVKARDKDSLMKLYIHFMFLSPRETPEETMSVLVVRMEKISDDSVERIPLTDHRRLSQEEWHCLESGASIKTTWSDPTKSLQFLP